MQEAPKGTIRIELTLEQKEQIRQATGEEIERLRLRLEALEERVAPVRAIN